MLSRRGRSNSILKNSPKALNRERVVSQIWQRDGHRDLERAITGMQKGKECVPGTTLGPGIE